MRVELQEISKVIMGQSPKGESYNEDGIGLPLLNGAADYKGNIFKPKKYTSEPTRVAHKGDILLGIRATIGNFAISDSEYCIGRGVAAIRVDEKKAHKAYILKCVERELSRIIHRAAGSTIKGIKKEDLTQMKLNLPPLDQQKKIAAILDAADAYRQKTKALIEKYDELTQSLFLDMFGDPVTNPKGWIKKTVLDIAKTLFAGGDVPKNNFSKESNKDYNIPIYSNGLNEKALYGFTNLAKVNEESITLSARGTIGHPEVRKAPFYPIIRLIVITPKIDIIHSQYLKRALSFLAYGKGGSSIPQLTIPMVKDKEVLIPPKELQNQFAERIQAIEAQKAQAQASLAQAEDLFNSLLQRAFKGELTA